MNHSALSSALKRPAGWPASTCTGVLVLRRRMVDLASGNEVAFWRCSGCRHDIVEDVTAGRIRNEYPFDQVVPISIGGTA